VFCRLSRFVRIPAVIEMSLIAMVFSFSGFGCTDFLVGFLPLLTAAASVA
jgi:hypothetical protein